jgi:hypothetical protein
MPKVFEWSRANSPVVQVGSTRVTPQSRVIALRLPFGGFVWHRPTSVLVEREGEAARRIPIRDVSIAVQIGFVLVSVVAWLMLSTVLRARKEHGYV